MELTFYLNQGRRCAQATMKPFLPDEISFEYLDELTGRNGRQVTSPSQIAYGLHKLNIPFLYPVKDLFLEEDFNVILGELKSTFGNNFLRRLNQPFLKESITSLKKYSNYYIPDNFNFHEIKEKANNFLSVCLINYDLFVDREDKKSGHYLLLKGKQGDCFSVMDSGPFNAGGNKIITESKLENSIMQTPLDYGIIFVKMTKFKNNP